MDGSQSTTGLLATTVNTSLKVKDSTKVIMVTTQVFGCMVLVADSWILLNMVLYGIKSKIWSEVSKRSTIDGKAVFISCQTALVLAIPRLLMTQVNFILPMVSVEPFRHCELLVDITNFAYAVASFSVYLFLWMRQRAIYQHPAVEKLAGKHVVVFSWICLVIFTMMTIAITCWFVVPSEYTHTAYGCVLKSSLANLTQDIELVVIGSYYALAGTYVISQLVLLSLLVYPMFLLLFTQNSIGERSKLQSICEVCSRIFNSRNQSSRLENTVRRSILCTLVAVTSDLITLTLVAQFLPATWPRSIVMAIYDISFFVNVLCILVTFEKFRNIVTRACGKSVSAINSVEVHPQDNSTVPSGTTKTTCKEVVHYLK